MYKEEFKDYDAKKIAAKLKQCRDYGTKQLIKRGI